MNIEFGKCPLCGKEIMKSENNKTRVLEGYDTFWILLSDTSRMKVAICKKCKKTLTEKIVNEIVTAHQEMWTKGITKDINSKISELEATKQQQLNYYQNLSSVKFALREKDLE